MKRLGIVFILFLITQLVFATGGNTYSTAVEIESLPFYDTGNTNHFSVTNTVGNTAKDVFYSIAPSMDLTNVDIDLSGSSFDTYLRVYDSTMTQLWADDDGGTGNDSRIYNIPLNQGSIYYICVEGYSSNNGVYVINVSADQSGSISGPGNVTNMLPTDGAVDVELSPTITWDFAPDTVTYDLLFGTDNPPTVEHVVGGSVSGQGSFTPGTLMDGTTYFLQIFSYDAGGGDSEDNYSFTTIDYTPESLVSYTPIDASSNLPLDTTLNFDFGINTENYDLYFDTVNPPVSMVTDNAVAGVSATYDPGILTDNTTYYWKVVLRNSNTSTETTNEFSFTTIDMTPGVISNESPLNTGNDIDCEVDLSWDFGINTETYDLYFDTVNPPTTLVVSDAVAGVSGSYDPGDLTIYTDYYWTVVSKNSNAQVETQSTYSFTTSGMLPSAISNVSPEYQAIYVDLNPTISWDFGVNTDTYDFYFDTVFPPVNQVLFNEPAGVSGQWSPPTLTEETYYYWRVVCKNRFTTGYSTSDFSFQSNLGDDWIGIGTGNSVNRNLPIEPYYAYSYSQTIYNQSELDVNDKIIDKIYYQHNGNGTLSNNHAWVVYIGHTQQTEYASSSDWIDVSSLIQVFSGDPVIGSDNWVEITLTTPFLYNNVDNLVVAVEENSGGYSSSSEDFYCSSVGSNRSIHYYSDTLNPSPASPPSGNRVSYIPNTRFHLQDLPLVPTTLVAPLDGETMRSLTQLLEWSSTNNANGYRLSLGTDNPPTNIYQDLDLGNVLEYSYNGYQGGVTYYWSVTPYYNTGDGQNIPVWSFSTSDLPPEAATYIAPDNQEGHVIRNPNLQWSYNGLFPTGSKLYVGTDNPPTNHINGLALGYVESYTISQELDYDTTYYWQVVPYNSFGDATSCPIWEFDTRDAGFVNIGEDDNIGTYLPINCYYGYNYTQSIYLQSELDKENFQIDKIYYYYNGGSSLSNSMNWTIYMGHTSLTEFSSNNDWIPLSQLTQVDISPYSTTPANPGWIEFELDSPFNYNNVDNLVIAIDENGGGYNSSSDRFLASATAGYRSIFYYSDSSNPSPSNPPNGNRTSFVPNIRIQMEPAVQFNEDTTLTVVNSFKEQAVASWTGNTEVSVLLANEDITFSATENWYGTEVLDIYDADGTWISELTVRVLSVNDVPTVVNPIASEVITSDESINLIDLDTVFTDVEDTSLSLSFGTTPNFNITLNPDNTAQITPVVDFDGGEMLYFYGQDSGNAVGVDSFYVEVLDDYLISEDFDQSGALPTGWTTEHLGTTTNPWTATLVAETNYTVNVSNSLFASCNERLLTPLYDLSSVRDIEIGFEHDFLTTSGTTTANFQYSIDGGTWTDVSSYLVTATGFESFALDALNYQGNVQFRFLYSASELSDNHWIIDNFSINGIVDDITLPSLQNLTVAPASTNSVLLGWDEYASEQFSTFEVEMADNEYFTNAVSLTSADYADLGVQTTTSVEVNVPASNAMWYFRARIVFESYQGEFTDYVTQYLSTGPVFTNNTTTDPVVNDNHQATISVTMDDLEDIDMNSIQYRVDYNLNDVYDESWEDYTLPIRSALDSRDTQSIDVALTLPSSGIFKFEFRAMDSYGHGYSYSGTNGDEGIIDDWAIEHIFMPAVAGITSELISPTELILSWDEFTGDRFDQFVLEYADNDQYTGSIIIDGTTESSFLNDTTTQINITALYPETTWYFRMHVDYDVYATPVADYFVFIPPTPEITNLTPAEIQYNNLQEAVVTCKITDEEAINLNSVQIRVDYDRNGSYNEPWVNYIEPELSLARSNVRTTRSDSVEISIPVYPTDSGTYQYEIRVMNSMGYGYSGTMDEIGISDDWSFDFIYDTTPPTDITVFAVVGVPADTEITLGWLITADDYFSHYELYYSTSTGVSENDALWSVDDDPNMGQIGVTFQQTILTGLTPGTQYFFTVRAVDLAGNTTALYPEISALMAGGAAPVAPVITSVTESNGDILLDWDDVVLDVNGNPITVTSYKVYADNNPYFTVSVSTLIGTTPTSDFTHAGGGSVAHKFYRVVAVVGGRAVQSSGSTLFMKSTR